MAREAAGVFRAGLPASCSCSMRRSRPGSSARLACDGSGCRLSSGKTTGKVLTPPALNEPTLRDAETAVFH